MTAPGPGTTPDEPGSPRRISPTVRWETTASASAGDTRTSPSGDAAAEPEDAPAVLAPPARLHPRKRMVRPALAMFAVAAVAAAVGTADTPAGSSTALPGIRPGLMVPGGTAPGGAPLAGAPVGALPGGSAPGGSGPITVQPASIASPLPDQRAQVAVRVAMAQIGLPYVWGGDGPQAGERGFDCSGLTHFAYEQAGVDLPRTAHTQFYAGPRVPDGAPLQPGDLVFYGNYRKVHHVGMYIGEGRMVNAPTFGKPVQTAWYRYSGDDYIGASRPASSGQGVVPPPIVLPVPDPNAPATPPEFLAPVAPPLSVAPQPGTQQGEAESAARSRAGAATGRDPGPVLPAVPPVGGSPSVPGGGNPSVPGGGAEGTPDPGDGTRPPSATPTTPKPTTPKPTAPQPTTPKPTTPKPTTPKPTTPKPTTPKPTTPPPTTPKPPPSTPPPTTPKPPPSTPPPTTAQGAVLTVGGKQSTLRTVSADGNGLPSGTGITGRPGAYVAQLGSATTAGPGDSVTLRFPDGRTLSYSIATRSEPGPRSAAADASAPLVLLVPAGDGLWTVLTAS